MISRATWTHVPHTRQSLLYRDGRVLGHILTPDVELDPPGDLAWHVLCHVCHLRGSYSSRQAAVLHLLYHVLSEHP